MITVKLSKDEITYLKCRIQLACIGMLISEGNPSGMAGRSLNFDQSEI
jgi:hypothetical protein